MMSRREGGMPCPGKQVCLLVCCKGERDAVGLTICTMLVNSFLSIFYTMYHHHYRLEKSGAGWKRHLEDKQWVGKTWRASDFLTKPWDQHFWNQPISNAKSLQSTSILTSNTVSTKNKQTNKPWSNKSSKLSCKGMFLLNKPISSIDFTVQPSPSVHL